MSAPLHPSGPRRPAGPLALAALLLLGLTLGALWLGSDPAREPANGRSFSQEIAGRALGLEAGHSAELELEPAPESALAGRSVAAPAPNEGRAGGLEGRVWIVAADGQARAPIAGLLSAQVGLGGEDPRRFEFEVRDGRFAGPWIEAPASGLVLWALEDRSPTPVTLAPRSVPLGSPGARPAIPGEPALELRFEPLPAVLLRVLDAGTLQPLAAARWALIARPGRPLDWPLDPAEARFSPWSPSPLVLPPLQDRLPGIQSYLIEAPAYGLALVDVDHALGGAHELRLHPRAALEVEVADLSAEQADEFRVEVRWQGAQDPRRFPPRLSLAAPAPGHSARIESLAPGLCVVRLVGRSGQPIQVYASAVCNLAAGQTQRVLLRREAQERAAAIPLEGEIRIPEAWWSALAEVNAARSAALHALVKVGPPGPGTGPLAGQGWAGFDRIPGQGTVSADGRPAPVLELFTERELSGADATIRPRRVPLTSRGPGEWSFRTELSRPGTVWLQAKELGQHFRLEVPAPGLVGVQLEVPAPALLEVLCRRSDSPEPVALEMLTCKPRRADSWSALLGRQTLIFDAETGVHRGVCPPGPVQISSVFGELHTGTIERELSAGVNRIELELHPLLELELEASLDGRPIPVPEGVRLEPAGARPGYTVFDRLEFKTLFRTDGPGGYRLIAPPLPGYSAPEPQVLELKRGAENLQRIEYRRLR